MDTKYLSASTFREKVLDLLAPSGLRHRARHPDETFATLAISVPVLLLLELIGEQLGVGSHLLCGSP